MIKSFFLFLCTIYYITVAGQYSNATALAVRDGLPSSTIYTIAQDTKGFIWIGTDAGLVRYDGTNFKIYTTEDGLPDNEVLGLLFDNKTDQLWILTYSKGICYYRDGTIYSKRNDPDLAVIKSDRGEYLNGNLQKKVGVFLYSGSTIYSCINNKITLDTVKSLFVYQVHMNDDSTMDVLAESGLQQCRHGKTIKTYDIDIDETNTFKKSNWIGNVFALNQTGKVDIYIKNDNGEYIHSKQIKAGSAVRPAYVSLLNNNYIFAGIGMGIYKVNASVAEIPETIWAGHVNSVFVDRDQNQWIATSNNGLEVLRKENLVRYNVEGLNQYNITALAHDKKGVIYVGTSGGHIYMLNNKNIQDVKLGNNAIYESIRAIYADTDVIYFLCNTIVKHDLKNQKTTELLHVGGGPKSILALPERNEIIVGLSGGVLTYSKIDRGTQKEYFKYHEPTTGIVDSGQMISYSTTDGIDAIKEITYLKRIVAMVRHPNGRIYCGSLDGIYEYVSNGLKAIKDSTGILSQRVAALSFTADSLLWIGTPSEGLLIYDGRRVIGRISTSRYLSYRGAICRRIIAGRVGEVWVATNGGINRINYHYSDSLRIDNITPITTSDGILSDDVNDILLDDSLLYAATAHGLSVLNVKAMSMPKPVPVYITSLKINDRDSMIHSNEYELSYGQNNLQVKYIGISLLSGGYIRYQYRLLGSSERWQTTSNTSVELRSLSPGTYIFEVAVLDKFGNRYKDTARVRFKIHPAFYQTVWFWAIIFLTVLGIGFYLIRSTFKIRQQRYEKEQGLNNKIIELEQQALKAQMNPHFIFNCLTAIQHFVNTEDIYSANMYLSNFAKLIRKTLDLSGEQYITLDKEISYLENYIELEKMRFQDKFNFTIEVSEAIDLHGTIVPPMLLQPIIENAIRHGLRYREGNGGVLRLSFYKHGNNLVGRVDDNGIGIKKSAELKSNSHVEYQSKGMNLTESRINAINTTNTKKIHMDVDSRYDDHGESTGTIVTIIFEQ